LSAAPGLMWVSGAMWAAAFIVLVPLALWMYTWIFAFGALWFGHYALAALNEARRSNPDAVDEDVVDVEATPVSTAHNPSKE